MSTTHISNEINDLFGIQSDLYFRYSARTGLDDYYTSKAYLHSQLETGLLDGYHIHSVSCSPSDLTIKVTFNEMVTLEEFVNRMPKTPIYENNKPDIISRRFEISVNDDKNYYILFPVGDRLFVSLETKTEIPVMLAPGIVYAPYIIKLTETTVDDGFIAAKMLKSRYSKKKQ